MTIARKTDLAIFLPSLFGAGGQRSMLNLAHGIADCGYNVDLVVATADGAFIDEVRAPVQLVDLKASRVLTSLPALVRYLRQVQPEVFMSVFNYVNIASLWATRIASVRSRIFVNEQNTVSVEASNASSWQVRMSPQMIRRFYPWADGIVVVSEGVKEDMAQLSGIAPERISVIHNPSVIAAEVQQKARAAVDHPWFQAGTPPVLLAVGRLEPQKDYPLLIEAFARLRKAMPAHLMILGEGRERPKLEALVREYELEQDICMPGFVANPFGYMARADLFVLSSRWEGLPTVLIEALCCGTPVVSTDCPSGPREILAGGQYGPLVPVGDAAALSDAIASVLQGERVRPPAQSWQRFELSTVVAQYRELLFGHCQA